MFLRSRPRQLRVVYLSNTHASPLSVPTNEVRLVRAAKCPMDSHKLAVGICGTGRGPKDLFGVAHRIPMSNILVDAYARLVRRQSITVRIRLSSLRIAASHSDWTTLHCMDCLVHVVSRQAHELPLGIMTDYQRCHFKELNLSHLATGLSYSKSCLTCHWPNFPLVVVR